MNILVGIMLIAIILAFSWIYIKEDIRKIENNLHESNIFINSGKIKTDVKNPERYHVEIESPSGCGDEKSETQIMDNQAIIINGTTNSEYTSFRILNDSGEEIDEQVIIGGKKPFNLCILRSETLGKKICPTNSGMAMYIPESYNINRNIKILIRTAGSSKNLDNLDVLCEKHTYMGIHKHVTLDIEKHQIEPQVGVFDENELIDRMKNKFKGVDIKKLVHFRKNKMDEGVGINETDEIHRISSRSELHTLVTNPKKGLVHLSMRDNLGKTVKTEWIDAKDHDDNIIELEMLPNLSGDFTFRTSYFNDEKFIGRSLGVLI